MKIKQPQLDLLNSFSCQRLTDDEINQTLLNNIDITIPDDESNPNYIKLKASKTLLDHIKNNAWKEDSANSIAYYIIKDSDEEIAMIFSIQNGCIYDSTQREEIRKKFIQYQLVEECIKARKEYDTGIDTVKNQAFLISHGAFSVSLEMLIQFAKQLREKNKNLLNRKISDIEREHAIYYAGEVHPGVELHIFWKNPNYTDKWKRLVSNLDFPTDKTMGEIFFWFFVIRMLENVLIHTGCKYFYLFAADGTTNGDLIAYYNGLGFLQDDKMGTIKPVFDYACKFMYQEINTMISKKDDFFNSFILEDEIIA